MEEKKTATRIHPLVAGAAVAVMLVSLTGVAAMTGLLPSSHGTASPTEPISAATAPAVATAATSPANLVEPQAEASPAKPQAPAPRVAQNVAPKNPAPARSTQPVKTAQAPSVCASCGRVESINAIRQEAQGSGLGMVGGAVLGGVLGNQVGGGNGRTLATVAGAVGGGYAGNEIEKRTRGSTTYEVRVRMEDGRVRTFPYAQQPAWNIGDRVRVVNGQLTAHA